MKINKETIQTEIIYWILGLFIIWLLSFITSFTIFRFSDKQFLYGLGFGIVWSIVIHILKEKVSFEG